MIDSETDFSVPPSFCAHVPLLQKKISDGPLSTFQIRLKMDLYLFMFIAGFPHL